jgi:hypothetical protein
VFEFECLTLFGVIRKPNAFTYDLGDGLIRGISGAGAKSGHAASRGALKDRPNERQLRPFFAKMIGLGNGMLG